MGGTLKEWGIVWSNKMRIMMLSTPLLLRGVPASHNPKIEVLKVAPSCTVPYSSAYIGFTWSKDSTLDGYKRYTSLMINLVPIDGYGGEWKRAAMGSKTARLGEGLE